MRQKGFTIVELMVVVSILGILASVMIVYFTGTANRGYDTVVQSDLDSISGQLEAYKVNPNNNNEFPHTTTALSTLGIKATKKAYNTTVNANFIYCTDATYQSFALVAKSRSNEIFMINKDGARPYTLSDADFTTAALCAALGMTWVSSGMSAPNTWQSWVQG